MKFIVLFIIKISMLFLCCSFKSVYKSNKISSLVTSDNSLYMKKIQTKNLYEIYMINPKHETVCTKVLPAPKQILLPKAFQLIIANSNSQKVQSTIKNQLDENNLNLNNNNQINANNFDSLKKFSTSNSQFQNGYLNSNIISQSNNEKAQEIKINTNYRQGYQSNKNKSFRINSENIKKLTNSNDPSIAQNNLNSSAHVLTESLNNNIGIMSNNSTFLEIKNNLIESPIYIDKLNSSLFFQQANSFCQKNCEIDHRIIIKQTLNTIKNCNYIQNKMLKDIENIKNFCSKFCFADIKINSCIFKMYENIFSKDFIEVRD